MKKAPEKEKRSGSRIHMEIEEDNMMRRDYMRRYGMSKSGRALCMLAIITFLSFVICLTFPDGMDQNNHNISLAWWLSMVKSNVAAITAMMAGQVSYITITFYQYVAAAVVGGAMSLTGTVYQGTLKNGLASPSTLGVQTGGVLGGSIYVLFVMDDVEANWQYYSDIIAANQRLNIFQRYEEAFFILAGCLVTVAFVIGVTKLAGKGKIKTFNLIITGMITGSVINGAIGLVQYWMLMYDTYGAKTYELRFMMMGTLSKIETPGLLALVCIPILIGFAMIMIMSSRLNALVFSEDEARSMGLRVDLLRNTLIFIVTCLVALVIAFCGRIAFLGFIVPHMARRVVGPDFRYLVPAGAMIGATVLMWIYYFGRLIGYADNLNFMTSIVGGAIFLAMLIRYRRGSNADWA